MGEGTKHRNVQAFSSGEAARFCFVTSETILNWIRSGQLLAQRTAGGQYRIRASDLRLFMTESGMDTGILDEQEQERPDCWEFHGQIVARFGNSSQEVCAGCLVRRSGARNCWELHGLLPLTACRHSHCEDCCYFTRFSPASRERGVEPIKDPAGPNRP
jgi:excisionase family DNA binding protein